MKFISIAAFALLLSLSWAAAPQTTRITILFATSFSDRTDESQTTRLGKRSNYQNNMLESLTKALREVVSQRMRFRLIRICGEHAELLKDIQHPATPQDWNDLGNLRKDILTCQNNDGTEKSGSNWKQAYSMIEPNDLVLALGDHIHQTKKESLQSFLKTLKALPMSIRKQVVATGVSRMEFEGINVFSAIHQIIPDSFSENEFKAAQREFSLRLKEIKP